MPTGWETAAARTHRSRSHFATRDTPSSRSTRAATAQSGGLFAVGGRASSGDSRALSAWLPADPRWTATRIGAWGISLGGGAVWRSVVEGIPLAAVAVETWIDLESALLPQNLAKSGAMFAFLNSVAAERTGPDVGTIRADALASRNLPAIRGVRGAIPVEPLQPRRRSEPRSSCSRAGATSRSASSRGSPRTGCSGERARSGLYIGNFGHAPSTVPPACDSAQVFAEASDAWFARFLKGSTRTGSTRAHRSSSAAAPYRELEQAPRTPACRPLAPSRSGSPARSGGIGANGTLGSARSGKTDAPARDVRRAGGGAQAGAVGGHGIHMSWRCSKRVKPDGSESDGEREAAGRRVQLYVRPRRAVAIRMISQATTIPRGSGGGLTLRGPPAAVDVGRPALHHRRPVGLAASKESGRRRHGSRFPS